MNDIEEEFRLSVTGMQELPPQALAGAASIGCSFLYNGSGALVLTKARDWYIEHRDVIRGLATPERAIEEAAELETNCKSRYEDIDSQGRSIYPSGFRAWATSGEITIVTLPGALPFQSYILWGAFTDLELWHWDSISEDKRVYEKWFNLTEKVATWACGQLAIKVITWLLQHDNGIDDRPEGDKEG